MRRRRRFAVGSTPMWVVGVCPLFDVASQTHRSDAKIHVFSNVGLKKKWHRLAYEQLRSRSIESTAKALDESKRRNKFSTYERTPFASPTLAFQRARARELLHKSTQPINNMAAMMSINAVAPVRTLP